MNALSTRLRLLLRSSKLGALLFLTLTIATVMIIAGPHHGVSASTLLALPVGGITQSGNPQLKLSLSQTKLVQGTDGTVYLDITIDTPARVTPASSRAPVDLVIVLDTSGSMSAAEKLPLAKKAVEHMLGRLRDNDRISLVTFSNTASMQFPLTHATQEEQTRLRSIVSRITHTGSTNISAGLERAREILTSARLGATQKVILLSDGEANLGITSPTALATLVGELTAQESIISTIGMGLNFNETLMAALADHGMGNYSYLEHLEMLGRILAKDLEGTRSLYAKASSVLLHLPRGVTLTDAGAYPIQRASAETRIMTGSLVAGSEKHFVATLKVPTHTTEQFVIEHTSLKLGAGSKGRAIAASTAPLTLAVVEPKRRSEAVASIDRTLYHNAWQMNNLGQTKQKVSAALRRGQKLEAQQALSHYNDELIAIERENGLPLQTPQLEKELSDLQQDIEEAFNGSAAEQQVKRNRVAKKAHWEGVYKNQRGSSSN